MSKTSCAARCSRGSVQGVLRAPAEGEGGVARREDLTAAAAATLERSAGTVAQGTMAARERRRRSAKVSRGRRAGCARPARCGRRVRVQRDSNGLGTWASEARGSGPLPRAGFPESGEVSPFQSKLPTRSRSRVGDCTRTRDAAPHATNVANPRRKRPCHAASDGPMRERCLAAGAGCAGQAAGFHRGQQ